MDIRNNMTNAQASPNFGKFKVKKNAVKAMVNRGEWEEFQKVIPNFERRGKVANIKVDVGDMLGGPKMAIYHCTVVPKRPLSEKFVNFVYGVKNYFNYGTGDLYIRKPNKSTSEARYKSTDFENMYQEAHKDLKANQKYAKDLYAKYHKAK